MVNWNGHESNNSFNNTVLSKNMDKKNTVSEEVANNRLEGKRLLVNSN